LAAGPFLLLVALLRRKWKSLVWAGAGLALGAGLSAAYLYPAAVEQDLIRHEVIGQIWPYHATYLFMYAGYSKEYFEFFRLLNLSWQLDLAVIAIAAFTLLVLASRTLKANVALWTAIGCFASFLMLEVSAPLGRRIPKIDIGVFSWRMLAITTLVAALLAGATAQAALDARGARRPGRFALFGVLAVAILFGGNLFTVFGVMAPVDNVKAFQPAAEHTNYAIIPRTAPARTGDLPKMERTRLDGAAGSVAILEWKPQHRVLKVKTAGSARLFVRTFSYPGWNATVDGHAAPLATDRDTGAILLDIPAGDHLVSMDFTDTPARKLGAWITLLSLVCVLAALAAGVSATRASATGVSSSMRQPRRRLTEPRQ
jgi:hypothetical protein